MTRSLACILCAWLAACAAPVAPTVDAPAAAAAPVVTLAPEVAAGAPPEPPEPTRVAPIEPLPIPDAHLTVVSTVHHHGSGCGSRGGPGYRLPTGKCASWRDTHRKRHRA